MQASFLRTLVSKSIAGRCNDVGLLAEEFDPLTGRMLGNFPQAYSHVGLINCALNLADKPAQRRSGGIVRPRYHRWKRLKWRSLQDRALDQARACFAWRPFRRII
jgi:hypothetical protein